MYIFYRYITLIADTYLGEKTLQINKWFLIWSNIIVYATKRTEFMLSGTRNGIASMDFSSSPRFMVWSSSS